MTTPADPDPTGPPQATPTTEPGALGTRRTVMVTELITGPRFRWSEILRRTVEELLDQDRKVPLTPDEARREAAVSFYEWVNETKGCAGELYGLDYSDLAVPAHVTEQLRGRLLGPHPIVIIDGGKARLVANLLWDPSDDSNEMPSRVPEDATFTLVHLVDADQILFDV